MFIGIRSKDGETIKYGSIGVIVNCVERIIGQGKGIQTRDTVKIRVDLDSGAIYL